MVYLTIQDPLAKRLEAVAQATGHSIEDLLEVWVREQEQRLAAFDDELTLPTRPLTSAPLTEAEDRALAERLAQNFRQPFSELLLQDREGGW